MHERNLLEVVDVDMRKPLRRAAAIKIV